MSRESAQSVAAAGNGLLARVRAELSASFSPDKPIRLAVAPGRIDVMGGLTAFTGGLLCQAPLNAACAAAVVVQPRADRLVQIFSFDLYDQQRPFTLMVPLDALASPIDALRRELAEPGRTWAAAVAGCLAILHDAKLIDLRDPSHRGLNVAMQNTVPAGAGMGSGAAMIVAAMVGVFGHLDPHAKIGPLTFIRLCERVERELIGGGADVGAFVAPAIGEPDALARLLAQPPFDLRPSLRLPDGVRLVAIDTGKRSGGTLAIARRRTLAAAMIGHKLILEKMRQIGVAAGRELVADPMGGFLGNLSLSDYRRFFRPHVPESIKGGQFLLQYHGLAEGNRAAIEPDVTYAVQNACDYHVLDVNRSREFCRYLEESQTQAGENRQLTLDKAGHLLYASHIAYGKDAGIGDDDCDVLVDALRRREPAGIYGARMTAGGGGGAVVVLSNSVVSANDAIHEAIAEYNATTGQTAHVHFGQIAGAWTTGAAVV